MLRAQAVEFCLVRRQTPLACKHPVRLGLTCTFPATEHRGVDPSIPRRFGNSVAMRQPEANGLTRKLGCIRLACLRRHSIPPVLR